MQLQQRHTTAAAAGAESNAAVPDPAATSQPVASGQSVESGQSEQPATSATDSDTFTDALTALTDETRRRVERNTLRTGGKTLTQLAMFDLDDIIRAEAQLELCIGALRVTREHGEDAGRVQLSEALGAALGDRRRYSSTFANGAARPPTTPHAQSSTTCASTSTRPPYSPGSTESVTRSTYVPASTPHHR